VFYLFSSSKRNKFILAALIFFVLKDIFIQQYEEQSGYLLYLFFGIMAYATIIIERLPRLKKIKFHGSVVLISMLLIAANTYTLSIIMDMIGHVFEDLWQVVAFYLYGAFMILLAVTAVAYNNQYNSNRSLLFIFMVFAFVISDIVSLFAYYFGIEFCFYLDRISYLLGFALLVNYGLNSKMVSDEDQELKLIESDNEIMLSSISNSAFAKADTEEMEIADAKASLYTFNRNNKQKRPDN